MKRALQSIHCLSKEPYCLSKEPYLLSNEPFLAPVWLVISQLVSKKHYCLRKKALLSVKRALICQKSPVYYQTSPFVAPVWQLKSVNQSSKSSTVYQKSHYIYIYIYMYIYKQCLLCLSTEPYSLSPKITLCIYQKSSIIKRTPFVYQHNPIHFLSENNSTCL